MKTDPIARALKLRKTLKQGDKVLVVDYSDTLQGKDTSRVIDLMPNVATGEYVFRTKVNVKPMDPLAAKEYGTAYFDVKAHSDEEIEAFVRKQEFDFPSWYKHTPGFSMKRILDYNPPFMMQVAGCNFHDGTSTGGCRYCFVDDTSNDGKPGTGKASLSVDETIESMLKARERIKAQYMEDAGADLDIKVLRVSGGEPTITLDWVLDLWREVDRRGLDFVGQLDSNLSTGALVDEFEKQGIYEQHIMEKLAEHPVKVLTALKGVSRNNLQENVQSDTTMEAQLHSLKRFITAGFDIFPQMYNPDPAVLKSYLDALEDEVQNISLRMHIGPLKLYGPNSQRLKCEAKTKRLDPDIYTAARKYEWEDNYERGCEVMDEYLREKHGVGYKEVTRSDVELKVKH